MEQTENRYFSSVNYLISGMRVAMRGVGERHCVNAGSENLV